ncbi:hypothetical protein MJO28_011169 [Puccinia striiformis f. sp. tritici]|uniref:DUF4219 domain-containing protein n=2 Tax=Puccinia striiformis TaxID=27350 RepID=A0A2S4UXZ4_9BASI|nr:hypothetical protein MJO28_011169 [Puccinia striiformis f. sp. tritici]POW02143.1 hypothetical protein PSTT_11965 [Puccinia striiformis]
MEPYSLEVAMNDSGLDAIPKLTHSNYHLWESMITIFLRARDLLEVCLHEQEAPWTGTIQSKDACALLHLSLAVDESIFHAIFIGDTDRTAHTIWMELKDRYGTVSIFTKMRVWEDWESIHYDSTLTNYLDRTSECLDQLVIVGFDVIGCPLFSAHIICRVTKVEPALMDHLCMVNDAQVSNPYLLIEKLRTLPTRQPPTGELSGTILETSTSHTRNPRSKRKKKRPRRSGSNGAHNPDTSHSESKCRAIRLEERNKRL